MPSLARYDWVFFPLIKQYVNFSSVATCLLLPWSTAINVKKQPFLFGSRELVASIVWGDLIVHSGVDFYLPLSLNFSSQS